MFAETENSGSEDRRHKNSGAENILFSKFIKKLKCKKGSSFNTVDVLKNASFRKDWQLFLDKFMNVFKCDLSKHSIIQFIKN